MMEFATEAEARDAIRALMQLEKGEAAARACSAANAGKSARLHARREASVDATAGAGNIPVAEPALLFPDLLHRVADVAGCRRGVVEIFGVGLQQIRDHAGDH